MIRDKISVVKGFQTSVNIAYDMHDDDKIKNFIPTASSIDIIEDVLHSINAPNAGRARLLVGAYGRGKSHIILVLMSLLLKKEAALFDALLKKMNELNPRLHDYVLEYLQGENKMLPVIVNGNGASLTQSFLNSLQQTLKNENLSDIMPETNFIAAVNAIRLWKKEYPATYKKFIESLGEPISSFIAALKAFDVNAYEHFTKLFPVLTSGSEFNPFIGFNVVELYEKVAGKLKDKGYNGIYVVYDEFSKYLESSIIHATVSDTKLLQDFAEMCDRSGDKQMHLMLISHKDISNYIDNNLPKDKVDGWRGVSGRFKHISLRDNFAQMYEIISTVIKKDKIFWKKFCKNNGSYFKNIEKHFTAIGILEESIAEVAVKGCYPLHPISTYILPRLSEKVAQNERTLFTFLSAEHKHTLAAFLETLEGDFPLLTPDYIYDYFEPLLRKEHYFSPIHKFYKLTAKSLATLDTESLCAKIIKTIALIYIIEQFEKLSPVYESIIDTFRYSVNDIAEIEKALKTLIDDKYIIYLKRSNGYLKIKESSGVDIHSEIENTVEKMKHTLNIRDILNNSAFDSYMYPTAYNDEIELTRYFDFTFIESAEFFAVENWERKIEDLKADGAIYAIIPKNEEEIEEIKKIIIRGKCSHSRVIFVVPKKCIDIEKICFEYNAANMLKESVFYDDLLVDEYDIVIEDLGEVISNFIFSYARPETGGAEYYFSGKKLNIKRKAQISAELSEICFQTYPYTPIINNESINKDVLPFVAINSRSKLLAGLLENELDINLGLTGTGQDVSFMRSTLVQTGILKTRLEKPEINIFPEDDNLKAVLAIINEFFIESGNCGKNFKELYDTLTLPKYGYGLKKGVIPIFIAAVLHHQKKYIVIKNRNEEVRITPELLNSINESPQTYTAYMENWNEEKTQYIEGLSDIFADYLSEKEKSYNTFSYIVLAMSRWYMSLPRYTKELTEVYGGRKKDKNIASHIKFLGSLKQTNINAREYLFDKLFEIYGYKDFSDKIIKDIRLAKKFFDSAKMDMVESLANDIKRIFCTTDIKRKTLTSIIKDWYEGLKPTTVNHLFSNNEEKVLQLMAGITNDEKHFTEQLAKTVTGLRVDDWDRGSIDSFLGHLEIFKKTVLDFDLKSWDKAYGGSEMYKLIFIDNTGIEVVKTFEKTEYTNRAKLLLNAITTELEDMGHAITEQEKRQVLMEVLEKMCV